MSASNSLQSLFCCPTLFCCSPAFQVGAGFVTQIEYLRDISPILRRKLIRSLSHYVVANDINSTDVETFTDAIIYKYVNMFMMIVLVDCVDKIKR